MPATIANLSQFSRISGVTELIIADASDNSSTTCALEQFCSQSSIEVRLVRCAAPQRASQMNSGAQHAEAELLWFVHADTLIPPDGISLMQEALDSDFRWGRFDVEFDTTASIMKVVACMMNLRSAVSGICTGDQGIFVERTLFDKVGGFPVIPLMEDVSLSRRLKQIHPPARIRTRIRTSARRWESNGYVRTIALMWTLRLLHSLGASPSTLHRLYEGARN